MPVINSIEELALTAGGGTKNLLTSSGVSLYIITGTTTLTSSWTIQPSGTPSIGMTYSFLYKASIDLGTSNITIFGETLPTNLADKEFRAESIWNGTAWVTSFLPDVSEDNIIPLTSIEKNDYRLIPAISEVMINGDNSPTITNAVQGEGTTDCELYYKVDPNEKVIKIIGRIRVTDVDETTVSGSLKVDIMEWVGHSFEPSLGSSAAFRIPVQLNYIPSSNPVDPTSVIGAYIEKYPTFNDITLIVPSGTLGTDTDADFKGLVNLELKYS